jgi:predicted XRE-type DNA-binding protein
MDEFLSHEEILSARPFDRARVRRKANQLLLQSRAVRLADFRKSANLTQSELAELLGIDQSNVSRIERGRIAKTEIGTLQSYVEALGGSLEIHVRVGKTSHKLFDTN